MTFSSTVLAQLAAAGFGAGAPAPFQNPNDAGWSLTELKASGKELGDEYNKLSADQKKEIMALAVPKNLHIPKDADPEAYKKKYMESLQSIHVLRTKEGGIAGVYKVEQDGNASLTLDKQKGPGTIKLVEAGLVLDNGRRAKPSAIYFPPLASGKDDTDGMTKKILRVNAEGSVTIDAGGHSDPEATTILSLHGNGKKTLVTGPNAKLFVPDESENIAVRVSPQMAAQAKVVNDRLMFSDNITIGVDPTNKSKSSIEIAGNPPESVPFLKDDGKTMRDVTEIKDSVAKAGRDALSELNKPKSGHSR